jgi:hypothetical protein
MPIATRLITLNLGSQTRGLPDFRMQAYGRLALLDYRLRENFPYRTIEQMRRSLPVNIQKAK